MLTSSCLSEKSIVLNQLGDHIPFEVAVGVNGRIWVNSVNAAMTILVANAIQNSERLTDAQTEAMVATLVKSS